jgi:hypothetical protein
MERRNPRGYPDRMTSAESGREMTRGYKTVSIAIDETRYSYKQPGWWCSFDDPDDVEGQLVDGDNQIAEKAESFAAALAKGDTDFIREQLRDPAMKATYEQLSASAREVNPPRLKTG